MADILSEVFLESKVQMSEFDVFLCYNSEDKKAVKSIGEDLKTNGIRPWFDEWELRPGVPWYRQLDDQIRNIKSAAVFFGPNGTGPWHRLEFEAFFNQFIDRNCPVIPVLLSTVDETPDLPVFFQGMTWVDFRKKTPNPLDQLIWGITGNKDNTSNILRLPDNKKVYLEITISEDIENWDNEKLANLMRALGSITNSSEIRIRKVERGSTKLTLELEETQAKSIIRALSEKKLAQFDIIGHRLVDVGYTENLISITIQQNRVSNLSQVFEFEKRPVSFPDKKNDIGKEIGKFSFVAICFIIGVFFLWMEIIGPRLSKHFLDTDIDKIIHTRSWITYEPIHYNPISGQVPDDTDSIKKELDWIKRAGFNGIITFNSNKVFSEIPEIAKNKGFSVIMGIWDPMNRGEVYRAISKAKFVDGYSVGHNGLDKLYSFSELLNVMQQIRFRTSRPVSTTVKILDYNDTRILEAVDWIFPDAHASIKAKFKLTKQSLRNLSINGVPDPILEQLNSLIGQEFEFKNDFLEVVKVEIGKDQTIRYKNRILKHASSITSFHADANRDARQTIDLANSIATEVKKYNYNKPILLKMVTYPMNGISNASLKEQALFFTGILENLRDSTPLIPKNVSFAFHSAFDFEWKNDWPFYDWDPYTGLLDNDGNPRPAVIEIKGRL